MLHLPPVERGLLLVVSGPSGVGKSTLIRDLRRTLPDVGFSVSATTRPIRPGERHGEHYLFFDEAAFRAGIANGEFLEHASVYGKFYGTPRAPVTEALAAGRTLVLDIDVQGARQIKESAPDAVLVFVLPPRRRALIDRLAARGTDAEAVVARRMVELDEQLEALHLFDYVMVNERLDSAKAQFTGIVLAELARRERHPELVHAWMHTGDAPDRTG